MSIQPIVRALLITAPIGICSCIGPTDAVPYDAAVPKSSLANSGKSQSPVKKNETPCESPEMITSDTPTVGSTPCEGAEADYQQRTWTAPGTVVTQTPGNRPEIGSQQRTWEPAEMH